MPGFAPDSDSLGGDILASVGDRYVLNFLLVEGEHGWHARCLEYDFVTQADTLQELYYEIERTVVGHLTIGRQAGHRPFAGLNRAASEYWRQFERSRLSVRPREAIVLVHDQDIPAHELQDLRIAEVT